MEQMSKKNPVSIRWNGDCKDCGRKKQYWFVPKGKTQMFCYGCLIDLEKKNEKNV